MTDDLVKWLRETEDELYGATRCREAADRIKKLEAALREIETLELDPRNSGQMWVETLRQIARDVLGRST